MSCYRLHLRRGHELQEDLDGIDLPDLDAAYSEAVRVARELRELWNRLPDSVLNGMAIEVADEANQMVLTVPFSDVAGSLH
jgi:hypothetical protein